MFAPLGVPAELAPGPGARAAIWRGAEVAWALLLGSPAAMVGALLLVIHLGLAVFGPALAPYHFAQFNILHTLETPSRDFLGGTDQFGRDQLRRDAAQRLGADHRRADHPVRLRDPAGDLARVPRARRPATGAGLGPHDQRGAPVPRSGAVARDPASRGDLQLSRGRQPSGRRAQRPAGTAPPGRNAVTRAPGGEPVLAVRDLRVTYRTGAGPVRAVKGVSLVLPPGRVLGLVGESGSGKSTVALAVMAALESEAEVTGEVRFRGENLIGKPERELRRLWGRRLAMVFQDPTSTLNPVLTVGDQLVEVLVEHEGRGPAEARARMLELFAAVQLPNPAEIARRYPHQLSGGQQQRVSIATALACKPALLVLAEPTTGLDVPTEDRILHLVDSLRQRTAAGILYITHNLGVIARLADEVAVMYAGEIAEQGPVGAVFARPRHPYTVALLDCLPRIDRPPATRLLPAIEGTLPDPRAEVCACQFAPRCALAQERCRGEHPGWFETAPGQGARCFYWERVPPPGTVRAPALAKPRGRASTRPVPLLEVVDLVHHYRQAGGLPAMLGRASSRATWTCSPPSFPAASGSAWQSRGPSPAGPTWSSATSRPPPSTSRCRRPSSTCWPRFRLGSTRPISSSRTTSQSYATSPTVSSCSISGAFARRARPRRSSRRPGIPTRRCSSPRSRRSPPRRSPERSAWRDRRQTQQCCRRAVRSIPAVRESWVPSASARCRLS